MAKRCVTIDRKAYLPWLHPGHEALAMEEARFVPTPIRGRQLVLVERSDSAQKLELVTEMRPHHLRAVRGDRELHFGIDECTERVPDRLLVRERLRQKVRR